MSRFVSFALLVVIAILVAVLFFKVIAAFVVPLFLATILVVMFGPLHRWFVEKCQSRGHLAAGLTTATIMLIVLTPIATIFYQAGREATGFYHRLGESKATQDEFSIRNVVAKTVETLNLDVSPEDQQRYAGEIQDRLEEGIRPLAVGGLQRAGKAILGTIILVVALYFFLLDGPEMIDTLMKLFPLGEHHKRELLERFVSVSRAIVVATLLAAFVQGMLAGAAFWMAGLKPLFLLMALTMILAMVPFVGSITVWLPCCLWLYVHENRVAAAVALAVFGTLVISQVDNVIKAIVLHGQSKLHPLLALLSVLGGVQALGAIGILVGPMAVAFLQTLLTMVKGELARLDSPEPRVAPSPAATAPALPADLRRIRMMLRRIAGRRP